MYEHHHKERIRSDFTSTIRICECECDCDCGCCIDRLYSAIEDDPELLQKMNKVQFFHTPLHEAAAAGNTLLALEIMNLMPSLARKLNPGGLTPLHLAVANGEAAPAVALVKLDPWLVGIKGRGGLTPLHLTAAGKPSENESGLELLAGLLVECPESMGVLNNRRQSAVHVAIENENVRGAQLLVNWLIVVARESELSIKDAHGNTALHVAARYCRSPSSIGRGGKIFGGDCLQRNEMMSGWINEEQDSYSSYFLWENEAQGNVGGEEIIAASSNLGTFLSAFPSSL